MEALELMLTLLTPAQLGDKVEEDFKPHTSVEKTCGSLLPSVSLIRCSLNICDIAFFKIMVLLV